VLAYVPMEVKPSIKTLLLHYNSVEAEDKGEYFNMITHPHV